MAAYFASDVHLRLDRPDRARRFARWVESLGADDTLTINGDLCDFWFAARQLQIDPMGCDGLRALAAFRARGGSITILPGNHDIWLGDFFEQTLGARFVAEPLDHEVHGLRVRVVHGHLLGARRLWKKCMESQTFLEAFRRIPSPMAHLLDDLLERSNEKGRSADDRRHLAVFRRYAAALGSRFDLVIIGHIHGPVDDSASHPRLVVLGGWHHQSSYLKIDRLGASLVVAPDPEAAVCDVTT